MKRNYTVLVEAGASSKVAAQLATKSVEVSQVLDQINVITVKADDGQLPAINAIPEVVAVEPDRSVGIA
ncbi:hypothetical protein ACFSUS_14585 [Spirosoma soli]|uniref:Uncharacterized protein n=1 Tax=Spirosoma soli TaxID=1770529 RepID=A0ABW5M4H5_9BACT